MVASKSQYQVRALERALKVLGAFSLEKPEFSLSELSMKTDLSPSTTLRLLSVLIEHGYIGRSSETDNFRLGVAVFERGSIYIQTTTIEAEAQSSLKTLATESNQTASLAILDRGEIVHVAVVSPERAIRYYAGVGQREMAHCTGLGKVLLSGLPDTSLETLVAQRGLPGRTDRTITTIGALRHELALVQSQGYAIDNEESVMGLRCIAAPIFNDRNRIVAAISASGAAGEFSDAVKSHILHSVRQAATDVSNRLGHRTHARQSNDLDDRSDVRLGEHG